MFLLRMAWTTFPMLSVASLLTQDRNLAVEPTQGLQVGSGWAGGHSSIPHVSSFLFSLTWKIIHAQRLEGEKNSENAKGIKKKVKNHP